MYLTIEDYMKKSEKPRIVLYGINGDRDMDMNHVSRPTRQEVKNVCDGSRAGSVTFTDTFVTSPTYYNTFYKAELYYDDVLVAMRMFPPIYIQGGDKLELTFNLCITCEQDGVLI